MHIINSSVAISSNGSKAQADVDSEKLKGFCVLDMLYRALQKLKDQKSELDAAFERFLETSEGLIFERRQNNDRLRLARQSGRHSLEQASRALRAQLGAIATEINQCADDIWINKTKIDDLECLIDDEKLSVSVPKILNQSLPELQDSQLIQYSERRSNFSDSDFVSDFIKKPNKSRGLSASGSHRYRSAMFKPVAKGHSQACKPSQDSAQKVCFDDIGFNLKLIKTHRNLEYWSKHHRGFGKQRDKITLDSKQYTVPRGIKEMIALYAKYQFPSIKESAQFKKGFEEGQAVLLEREIEDRMAFLANANGKCRPPSVEELVQFKKEFSGIQAASLKRNQSSLFRTKATGQVYQVELDNKESLNALYNTISPEYQV